MSHTTWLQQIHLKDQSDHKETEGSLVQTVFHHLLLSVGCSWRRGGGLLHVPHTQGPVTSVSLQPKKRQCVVLPTAELFTKLSLKETSQHPRLHLQRLWTHISAINP